MRHDSPIWHPYTRFSALRGDGVPVITRGEGPWLFDDAGTRYFDATSSWWCSALGHNHPVVMEAIRGQTTRLDHSILGHLAHPGALALAERLAGLMPSPDRKVLFASDGSCAVEAALKVAVQYHHNRGDTSRTGFATLEEPYHGDTLGAVSVGYLEHFHAPFRPLLFPALPLPVPRGPEDTAAVLSVCRERLAARARELAGLIVEPLVQGSSGMRFHPPAFLTGLATICRELGILFICDEIATGFGRTGTRFAFEQAGIDPDLVLVGKALTAGTLPLSATIARESIWATFHDDGADHTFYHGHTFAGNPLACAAALASLDVMDEENLPVRAARLRTEIWDPFAARLADLPGLRETRALGMIWVVEMDAAWSARAPALRRRMRDLGLLVRPLGSVVYLMPPLNTSEADLAFALERFERGLRELQ